MIYVAILIIDKRIYSKNNKQMKCSVHKNRRIQVDIFSSGEQREKIGDVPASLNGYDLKLM